MNRIELINCMKHVMSDDHFIFKQITFNNKNLIVYLMEHKQFFFLIIQISIL